MRNLLLPTAAAVAAFVFASPASAAFIGGCQTTDISPTALACNGFYEGNLLNNANVTEQQDALDAIGFDWDGEWSVVDLTKVNVTNGDDVVFDTMVTGITYIGIHWGAGQPSPVPGQPGGVTGFYKLDAGTGLAGNLINLNFGAGSSAVLYTTGGVVPEPAAWALMITGFGMVGAAMRRRTKVQVTYA